MEPKDISRAKKPKLKKSSVTPLYLGRAVYNVRAFWMIYSGSFSTQVG